MLIFIYIFLIISGIEPMFVGLMASCSQFACSYSCVLPNFKLGCLSSFLLGYRSPLAIRNIHLLSVTCIANVQFVSNIAFCFHVVFGWTGFLKIVIFLSSILQLLDFLSSLRRSLPSQVYTYGLLFSFRFLLYSYIFNYSELISISDLMCEAVFSSRWSTKYTVPLIKLTTTSPSIEMPQPALRTELQAWVEAWRSSVKPWLLIPHSSDWPHVLDLAGFSLEKCLLQPSAPL